MPYYDYTCSSCGTFDQRRPLSESALPAPCPKCGQSSPRALSAPFVGNSASSSPAECSRPGGPPAGGCGSGGCGHVH